MTLGTLLGGVPIHEHLPSAQSDIGLVTQFALHRTVCPVQRISGTVMIEIGRLPPCRFMTTGAIAATGPAYKLRRVNVFMA